MFLYAIFISLGYTTKNNFVFVFYSKISSDEYITNIADERLSSVLFGCRK